MYLYVLRLGKIKDPKFFIGKSEKIYNVPLAKLGGCFAAKYQPSDFEEVIVNGENINLDVIVLRYMRLYGIDNVRGGTFSSLKLCGYTKRVIQRLICDQIGVCYRCKRYGHSASDCGKFIIFSPYLLKIF